MKIKVFFYSLFFCFIVAIAQAKELNLSVDKNVVVEGDTIVLTVEYDGNSNNEPDLSGLNSDFNILSKSTSQSFNFINGVASQSKKWAFILQPLRVGKITIPPVKLDNLYSNSEDIEVQQMTNVAYVPDSHENSNSPYFQIEQEFDVKNPYVQQQVTFFVHIYDSLGLQNGVPTISNESMKDWIVVPLTNKPIVRQEIINHKRMNVETYAFAAFPQKSGNLIIPQVSFEGFYVKNEPFSFPNFDNDINFFGVDFHSVFGQQVPVRMKTKEQTISVRPVPANSLSASWMPLNNLELTSQWNKKSKFKTGEALTRTITLKATGMTESMLPQLSFPDIKDFKQYPEKPVVSEEVINGKIVTTATFNNVYIPEKSGKLTIPTLKIQWFNVDTQKIQIANLAEEIIDIEPSTEEILAQNDANLSQKKASDFSDKENNNTAAKNSKQIVLANDINAIQLALSKIAEKPAFFLSIFILFLFGIVLSIYSLWQKKKKFLRNSVIRAIKKHDYKRAKENLLVWANHKFNLTDIQNFNDLAKYLQNEAFSEQLSLLNKILYSNNGDYFDGAKFVEIFKKVDRLKIEKNKKNSNVLPNLYD